MQGHQHGQLAGLEHWKSCVILIDVVNGELSRSGMLTWLQTLTSQARRSALAEAGDGCLVRLEVELFEDALKHVHAINLATDRQGPQLECKLEWPDRDLVAHFSKTTPQAPGAAPGGTAALEDLLEHFCAYSTLLTGTWRHRNVDAAQYFHVQFRRSQQQRLYELLAVPNLDWRPFFMQLLRELTTKGGQLL
jgi:hypothetical protein